MNNQRIDRIAQIGLVVKDVKRTATAFSELLGLPMPEIINTDDESARPLVRGEHVAVSARLAFFTMGDLELELIEPTGGNSIWQEFLDTKGEGVHHLAFRGEASRTLASSLGAKGFKVLQTAHFPGGKYTYFDTEPLLAVTLELLEEDP